MRCCVVISDTNIKNEEENFANQIHKCYCLNGTNFYECQQIIVNVVSVVNGFSQKWPDRHLYLCD